MRHNLLSGPIAAGARRMLQASATAGLIALSRRPLRLLSRFLCTSPGAVNLATVAVTADHDRKAAACAHKEPSRRGLRTVRCPTWTRAATSGIMPRHACSARCRGTASRRDLPVAIGAVPSQSRAVIPPYSAHVTPHSYPQRTAAAAASTFNLMNSKISLAALAALRRHSNTDKASRHHQSCRQICADSDNHRHRARSRS